MSAYSVSKATVVKLSENAAHETARYGIGVFSVHPGLLPIGITETVAAAEPTNTYEERIWRWAMDQMHDGHGAEPDRAAELIPQP